MTTLSNIKMPLNVSLEVLKCKNTHVLELMVWSKNVLTQYSFL